MVECRVEGWRGRDGSKLELRTLGTPARTRQRTTRLIFGIKLVYKCNIHSLSSPWSSVVFDCDIVLCQRRGPDGGVTFGDAARGGGGGG